MNERRPYEPRKKIRLESELYEDASRIYFLTLCARTEAMPFMDKDINGAILETLVVESRKADCTIYTYCLMPDHLHFLVRTNRDGISVLDFAIRFKSLSTRIAWGHQIDGQLWQKRFHDHIVRTNENLLDIARYILNNPVRKGLCSTSDDWPWGGHVCELPL